MSDYDEGRDHGYSIGFERGYVKGCDDKKEKIIERLSRIHTDYVRQSNPARNVDFKSDFEIIYMNCADELEEVIKDIEHKLL